MKMKLKKAIEICKNINSDNISDEETFEAIKIVINSQHNSMLLSKPFLMDIIKFYSAAYDELKQQVLPIERVPLKPIREARQNIILRCPVCRAVIEKSTKFCGNCGQAIKWGVKNDT